MLAWQMGSEVADGDQAVLVPRARVDRRFTMEDGITCWHHVGARRPVGADRRQRAMSAHPHAPPVEQHAGQITGVIGVQAGGRPLIRHLSGHSGRSSDRTAERTYTS